MNDKSNNNDSDKKESISKDIENLSSAMNNLRNVFGEFKESNKDLMIKTGSSGMVSPEDISEDELKKLASSLKDLENNIKNIKI